MTKEEWILEYSPIQGRTKPTSEQLAYPEALKSYWEAVEMEEWIQAFHEIGGLLVIEYEKLFYVVYGLDYVNGYVDYNEANK